MVCIDGLSRFDMWCRRDDFDVPRCLSSRIHVQRKLEQNRLLDKISIETGRV
jgi:hypothetical protein